ncbi:hypothetical protein ACLMJK_002631 [Lecanora helva]
MISARDDGFGRHLWALPDPKHNTSQFLKILYIYIIFYYCAVSTVKLCILTFYRRIFPVSEIRIWLYVGYTAVGCYFVATLCVTTFQCQPIHGFWDKAIGAHCISGDDILVIPGALNAVLDGFVILMPLPLLWRLRTTRKQKGVLTGLFLCGGFVCVISIVRLIVLSRLSAYDVTWNYVNAAIWSAAEPSMSVIAACLPSLRPLAALVWRGTYRGPTFIAKSSQATDSSTSSNLVLSPRGKEDVQRPGKFRRLQETFTGYDRDRWGHETAVQGGPRQGSTAFDDVDLEELNSGIRVKNVVTVTSHPWDYKDRVF